MAYRVLALIFLINIIYGVCSEQNTEHNKTPNITRLRRPSSPLYPVCGYLQGAFRNFSNIDELKYEQSRGYHWTFCGEGVCPSQHGQYNPDTPIWAKYQNELRIFSNMLEFSKFSSCNKWTIVQQPLSSQALCATYGGETQIFKDSIALKFVKLYKKQNWSHVPCPRLAAPLCLKIAAGYGSLDQTLSWTIESCGSENIKSAAKLPEQETTSNTAPKVASETAAKQTTAAQEHQICAQYKNMFRKFDNISLLVSENLQSSKEWYVVACPITKETICAVYEKQKALFRNLESLNLAKTATGNDWAITPCPVFMQPLCFNFDLDFVFRVIKAWLIIPCSEAEQTPATIPATTTSEAATTELSLLEDYPEMKWWQKVKANIHIIMQSIRFTTRFLVSACNIS